MRSAAAADQGQSPPSPRLRTPRAGLAETLAGRVEGGRFAPSPIPGIYEIVQGAEVSYLTADGKVFYRRQSLRHGIRVKI